MFGKKPSKKLLFQAPALDGEKETHKKDYAFETKLGDGAFGQVWKIKHKKTGKIYACKQVGKDKVIKMIEQFRREVLIMYELSHPNIIKLFHHFEDEKFFYLVMELAEGGNLFQRLAKENTFNEKQAHDYFCEILEAVQYLHSHSPVIIHRDIKPENILISGKGALKLTDFGWSNYYSVEQGTPRYTICGTFEYLCPEMVKETGHTPSVDIWCLGILLYEMLCGYTPFKAPSKDSLMENISKGKIKYPVSMSSAAKNLIAKILEKNPVKRITLEKIKQHDWIKDCANVSPMVLQKDSSKNYVNGVDAFMHLNSFRKSLNLMKSELSLNVEIIKTIKENLKNIGVKLREEIISVKLLEAEILEKRRQLIDSEETNRILSEKLSDSSIALEKLGSPNLSELTFRFSALSSELERKTHEMYLKEFRILELNSEISTSNTIIAERTRYLSNLKQYCKKLKAKGSILHHTRQSQIVELQISYEVFKNQIAEHETKLEKIETPENKLARELMIFIKENKNRIIEDFVIEEKLKSVEEKLTIKEVDLERIKIEYLDNKRNIMRSLRLEKDKLGRKTLRLEPARLEFTVIELIEKELEDSRKLEKKYKLETIEIHTARERLKSLKTKIATVNARIKKIKLDRSKIKLSIDLRVKNIEGIEMELGMIKSNILRIENVI